MQTVLRIAMMLSLAAAGFLGVACQPAPPPEPESAAAPTAEDELRALTSEFEAAWAAGDAGAVAALFTEDGDSLTAQGYSQGRAAVEDGYRQNFEGPFMGTTIAIETTSVRLLRPDVAVSDGTYEISGFEGPDGEDLPPSVGLWTAVDVKTADGWRLACSRPMVPVPMPDASE